MTNTLIKFDNKTFEYHIHGSGEQTIVFLNGFRMPLHTWDKVYPGISTNYCTLLFNRLGVGKSSKALTAQDGQEVVNDVYKLLSILNVKPPYIFVAHSLGGIFAILFARTYEKDTSGIVFVDSPHPLEILLQKQHKPPLVLQLLNDGFKYIEKVFDRYQFSEDECINATIAQIDAAKNFPDIPIAVVSGTRKMPFVPSTAFQLHQEYQQKLLDLSQRSKHYCCNNSGHFPQITEPGKITEAISDIIAAVKSPMQKM